MKVLLDTCCLSELQKPKPSPHVIPYLKSLDQEAVFTSVIVIGEIAQGIALLEHGSRRLHLEAWLGDLKSQYVDRILPVTLEIAERWAELAALSRKSGHPIGLSDALLAASALCHDLCVVTRNVKDFESTGVKVINPW